MSDTTTARLIALAARQFGRDASQLAPEQDMFEQLGIDSFQALELLSELELEFDVEIPDYELQDIQTFAGLAALIERKR